MKCYVIKCDNFLSRRTIPNYFRNHLTFVFYAGLLANFIPVVLCKRDWAPRLTFEEIFNSTDYAQIKHTPGSHKIPSLENSLIVKENNYNFEEDIKGNEIDYEEYSFSEVHEDPLLVGFSHDPFRYSVPKEDFLKGVRNMNPQMYMNRGKRGVLHLYNMMYCATGCEPLSYKGYGCYCGFLGSGRPTDGIDRCCKMHDECYENIYCPFFTVYFQPYYWKCYRGEPLCALENYKTQHQFINGCAARLCECDRQFAMCVKRYRCPRRRALCHSSPLRLLQNLLMAPYK